MAQHMQKSALCLQLDFCLKRCSCLMVVLARLFYVHASSSGSAHSDSVSAAAGGCIGHELSWAKTSSAAINFGGYCGSYPSLVPVGNTGTTSTGQGV